MPLVEVTLAQGRSPQTVRTMISRLTDALVESGVAPRENIRVVVREVPPEHFAAGDVTIAERNAAQSQAEAPSPSTSEEPQP